MCAIAGVLGLPYTEEIGDALLRSMQKRGPDGKGTYLSKYGCLLHARLAIVDISGGAQPMVLDQGKERYIISYNGELYNTEELRKELLAYGHSFYGHSDTEVLLHGYAQWKEALLEKCNGIFAFAVLEEHSGRVFFARDRIGVKPLFYKIHENGLLFSSEIKTILSYPGVQAELDETGVAQLLLLGPGRIPGSGVLREIQELKPGHYAIYENGKLHLTRYWKLKDRIHTDSFEDTAENVRFLVLDAIRRQMVSDVPVGTFLSGGLDSSLISAICARELDAKCHTLDTFSLDYVDNDKYFQPGKYQPNSDTEYIHIMQSYLESHHHWTILSPQQLMDAMEESVLARDLPGMADVDSSLLLLCQQIRPYVKVALSGECADEIFGGYPWYRDPSVRNQDSFPWAKSISRRTRLLHPDYCNKLDGETYIRDLYLDSLRDCDILPENSPTEKRIKQMVNLNFNWFMQTLLDRKDRMSMYHGLEVRVPFCDYRIAEYLYGVPWEYKEYRGYEKGLLRYAMRGVLPDPVLYRKKSPYPKTHDPLYLKLAVSSLKRLLEDPNAVIFSIVNRQNLESILTEDFANPWYGQLMQLPQTIVYLLQIQWWLERYSVHIR